jgi:hypothetical protein
MIGLPERVPEEEAEEALSKSPSAELISETFGRGDW